MLLEEASRVLPAEVLELVKAKPPEERLPLLQALAQAVEVEYGQLEPSEWAAVRRDPERFGFKPTDLPEGADPAQCVALAARGGGAAGGRRLCGFLLATLEPLQRARREQARGRARACGSGQFQLPTGGSLFATSTLIVGGSSSDGLADPWGRGRGGGAAAAGPLLNADEDAAAVLKALSGGEESGGDGGGGGDGDGGGAEAAAAGPKQRPPKLGIAIQLLGIDYEFRRQGVGGALLDLLGDVAAEAGAGVLWLWAARHNPSAAAFWRGRGFRETGHTTSSAAGEFVLMVKAARAEVIHKYHRDTLGLRHPQPDWNASAEVARSKHTPAAAAEALHNALPAAALRAADARAASLPRAARAGAFDARHHRDHAFTRGDATTGWAHSTETGAAERGRWLAALDARVSGGAARRCRSVPRGRPTLVARAAAAAGAARASKERAVEQRRAWAAAFGADGAAAMAAAAGATAARAARGAGPRARPRVGASAEDLWGVAALPGMGLLSDDG
ncbi:MAG: hypothetical protein J3K34DRAFT_477150 [Monoraphidium minutum]|nr:MAG: hypothetical protein J3K34DRAFT_477150 [Monoraphidium minutum]